MAQLREAAAHNPGNPIPIEFMADRLGERRDLDGVVAVLREGIQNSPGQPIHHSRQAELLNQKRDFRGALDEYQDVLKLEGDSPQLEKMSHRLEAKLRE